MVTICLQLNKMLFEVKIKTLTEQQCLWEIQEPKRKQVCLGNKST